MNPLLQIMLVDDDRVFNSESTKIIRENGITNCVKTALNGGHAILLLDQIYSDLRNKKLLILLDPQMPIMDGIEFLKHYSKCNHPFKKNISIAFMVTPETSDEVIDEAKSLGIYHFLNKPLSLTALKEVLGDTQKFEKVA